MLDASPQRGNRLLGRLLLVIFASVCWFPQFNQTDWNVLDASAAPTIYNIRPIPAVTASIFDYLFSAAVVIWILTCKQASPRRLVKLPLVRPTLALFAIWTFHLLRGLWLGSQPYTALREYRNEAYLVLVYLMVVSVFPSLKDLRRFFRLLLLLGFAIGIYGLIRLALGIGKEFLGHLIVFYDIADSIVLFMCLLAIASLAVEGLKTHLGLLVSGIAAVPMLLTFVLSYRRGAWLGCLAGFGFLICFYPGRLAFRRLIIRRLLPLLAVMPIAFVVSPALREGVAEFAVSRAYSIMDSSEDSSNVFRILDAQNAIDSYLNNPVFGVGAGGRYELRHLPADTATIQFMEHVNSTSHNGYLYILYKSGSIGFISYMIVLVTFLKAWFDLRRVSRRPGDRSLCMAVGGIMTAFMVTNITEPLMDLPRCCILLGFVMGCQGVMMRELVQGHAKPKTVVVTGQLVGV